MRIKVKWTSCGHRKAMAVIVFYDYADGTRQSIGYVCPDCFGAIGSVTFSMWSLLATSYAYTHRSIDLERTGDIRIVLARIAGAEEAVPNALLEDVAANLEAQKEMRAQEAADVLDRSGIAHASKEEIMRGITFGTESGASPDDYKRR